MKARPRDSQPTFGSDDDEERFLERCHEQARSQTVEYTVAPLCTVVACDGRLLREGEEVTLALLGFTDIAPQARLQRLLAMHIVLQRG